MRFSTPVAVGDRISRRSFQLGDVPGILWEPSGGPRAIVLLAHGGGQHKTAPSIEARARRLAASGVGSVSLDAPGHGDRPLSDAERDRVAELRRRMAAGEPVADLIAADNAAAGSAAGEWRAALDALEADGVVFGPVGWWGVSLGAATGVPLLAAEPRIAAAVIGLVGAEGLVEHAARVSAAVRFLVQWDDAAIDRRSALALFDGLGTGDKSLHANPGDHGEVPQAEHEDSARFLIERIG